MAVYTKIKNKDVLTISNDYKIGGVTKFEGIKKGIENTNYLLRTSKEKYIVTIFEKNKSLANLEKFVSINGAKHYNLELNKTKIILKKRINPLKLLKYLYVKKDKIVIFDPRFPLFWEVEN